MSAGNLASAVAQAASAALSGEPLATGEEGTPSSPGAEGEVETTNATGTQTPEAGNGTAEEEVPTSYFGVDLSALPAEARREVIAAYSEQNKVINQLQRAKAEAAQAAPASAPEPVAETEEFTDDSLVTALGLDLDDPVDQQVAPKLLPMARAVLDLKAELEGIKAGTAATSEQVRWDKALDGLEAKFGELPVERVDLFEQAADSGISDPEAAYWAAVGPTRLALMQDLSKRLAETRTEGKRAATTPRTRSASPVDEKLQSTNVRDATVEAARKAAEKLGISWDDAWKSDRSR